MRSPLKRKFVGALLMVGFGVACDSKLGIWVCEPKLTGVMSGLIYSAISHHETTHSVLARVPWP